jgi:hypothetical protein
MRTVQFLFAVLFFAGSVPGAGVGYSFAQSTQPASSQNGEKAVSGAEADGQKNAQSTKGKNQYDGSSDERPINSKNASKTKVKRSSSVSPAKPAANRRLSPSANALTADNLRTAAPENAPHFSQAATSTASGTTTAAPSKPRSNRSNSDPVPSFAVSGQQFRNSRNPGAHLVVSGGPANSTRGTAAINGSNIKPKP